MKAIPTNDRVIVKPEEEATETKSGIVLAPNKGADRPDRGVVMAVGPGRWENGENVQMPCAVGDTVLYGKYSGDKVDVDGEELLFIRSTDVMAVLEVDDGDE